ncbi:MAG: hypothetical protein WAZ98_03820 [Cyclobacteriaceae bacterium]
MKPKKIEFDCGETRFSQSVTLEISHSQNQEEVKITKHAASQRDDTQFIFGLSIDNILRMAEAIKEYKK